MTRGKYAAIAASRRAEAAEITADRYIEQAAKWKRIATENKAMAELAAGLQKELRQLRSEPTMLRSEHQRVVDDLRSTADAERVATQEALDTVLTDLGQTLRRELDVDRRFECISPALLRAVRALPGGAAEKLWRAMGFERELRRAFADPGYTNRVLASTNRELTAMALLASESGYEHGKIPHAWLGRGPSPLDDDDVAS